MTGNPNKYLTVRHSLMIYVISRPNVKYIHILQLLKSFKSNKT